MTSVTNLIHGSSLHTSHIAFTHHPAMRNFWALPAVLRIALASQHTFSVFDDLLAFPQVCACSRPDLIA
jgi:hypothetical protein